MYNVLFYYLFYYLIGEKWNEIIVLNRELNYGLMLEF